jgi:uncharacterized protein YjiS (DUF1127 family)
MSSLNEMNEALRRQESYGLWAPAANVNRPRAGLIATLLRAMKRRHTANLLRQLDSRLLDDIGIMRGEIDRVAAKAAAEAVVGESALAMPGMAALIKLPASIWGGIARAWQRQATIVALQRLPNHTLADIGIERGRIAEIVDAMMAQASVTPAPVPAKSAKAATPKTAVKPAAPAVPAQRAAA